MSYDIPFIRPSFPAPEEISAEYADIVEANWFTNFGPKERRFSREIEQFLGQGLHAVTCGNGTLALIAGLMATVGPGDRNRHVLMPSFTFVAVAQAAVWAGYRPWFIDIEPATWQPSRAAAREVLGSGAGDVAAILLPNVFGVGNPDIADWEALADEAGIPLIVDSAAGFGSRYTDGERLGGRGTCEIFSFHATKPFAVGEGGALVSADADIAQKAQEFQNFGFNAERVSTALGINGKLSEFAAAVGLRQLPGLDDRIASRREVLANYVAELADCGMRFQPNAESSSLCFASIQCSGPDQKAAILKRLAAEGVEAREYYNPPVHRHPYFLENAAMVTSSDLTHTDELCGQLVSLPIHDHMPDDDVERVVSAIRNEVGR